MIRTANPALNNDAFAPADWAGVESDRATGQFAASRPGAMSLRGTVLKSGILLGLAVASAGATWVGMQRQAIPMATPWVGAIVGLVVGLVLMFAPRASAFLAPIYAIAEGALLGGLSLVFAERAGGAGGGAGVGGAIIVQAVALTFGIFASLLLSFSLGLIRMGATMTKIIVVATMGIGIVYVLNMLLHVFGVGSIPFIHQSGPLGIAFSMVVVVLASLNLVLDFQRIEDGVRNGAPKYMEWYAGYALLVTLVWLYIELLRLLAKLNSRR